ncbi:MAG: hypothetical protein CO113_10905 [Elusimicrobia bacterium CG_4_9_14_3_um_filter_62_55]|nr:MAG: hypothetical protein COX66_08730 [Elusimicrobia bacterium CG_4_10_14_0_2_um_filter_63_34]PJB25001.1 MAG: hypothetical protein CO113_10905 [Elusimicrobia bacterium CG_4_9_14_3_um_filter_62_55]
MSFGVMLPFMLKELLGQPGAFQRTSRKICRYSPLIPGKLSKGKQKHLIGARWMRSERNSKSPFQPKESNHDPNGSSLLVLP